jgi:cysteinyl-tRNA synthetase
MAESILGLDFDVHGGGSDLVFPHHENEIAQTEAARGRPLARIWMHNGLVRFGEEKMAKSVGNVRLLRDVLDEFGRDVLVIYFLSGHYRQPLSFSSASLESAERSLERVLNFCRLVGRSPGAAPGPGGAWDPAVVARRDAFFAALRDDFNTPQALAALFDLISEGNRRLEAGGSFAGAEDAVAEMLGVIGLDNLLAPEAPAEEEALRMVEERERARRAGNFERADELRRALASRGYEVRDTGEGPVLVRTGD